MLSCSRWGVSILASTLALSIGDTRARGVASAPCTQGSCPLEGWPAPPSQSDARTARSRTLSDGLCAQLHKRSAHLDAKHSLPTPCRAEAPSTSWRITTQRAGATPPLANPDRGQLQSPSAPTSARLAHRARSTCASQRATREENLYDVLAPNGPRDRARARAVRKHVGTPRSGEQLSYVLKSTP